MGDENPIRTLGDYSKPSHEGYRNTIELPKGTMWWLRDPTPSVFPPRRTAELQNNILRFQQRQDKSLYDAWTRFKDLLLKVPHHGLDLWLQVQIFYDHVDSTTQMAIDYAAGGRLRKLRPEVAWETIKNLAQYEEEGWNDPIIPEEEILDYENPNLEQLLGVMECKVSTLMEKAISLMGKSESLFGMSSNMMHQLPPKPSCQEAFEDYVMNFILDQEERVKQLEEYMGVIGSDFMQLSLKEHTPPVTYPEEVEETLGTSIEVEPLDETQLEDLRLNTCNHDLPLSSMEVPSFDESEPQPQPLHNRPPLDRSLGEERGLKPPIKPHSTNSFRIKVVDNLTIHTPPLPHLALLGIILI
ncbi:zinc finger, CCHC-type containing protein [Tanacetum coccineum]